ncbi:hypothetical protein J4460_01775 [Candidatus Woesearchaeota archaeon]|nr:MAG: hypothetical protein QS99_C0003G0033 [archaeon GW2011_AR4]MBS3129380.1 hypothetical protein [Candidatus Woesearchaeota archaeon]HIH38421.1 hypothetical protein [Candidatus Woesearchaeota archaeon]HIH48120.1 hypothetical protein [Candidatus Woesearchaeota archaeon]HIJ03434.1 hypothetical protein [Candidatus Woesearchaeota archaeon]
MKKIVALLLVVIIVLMGCGKKEIVKDSPAQDDQVQEQVQPVDNNQQEIAQVPDDLGEELSIQDLDDLDADIVQVDW